MPRAFYAKVEAEVFCNCSSDRKIEKIPDSEWYVLISHSCLQLAAFKKCLDLMNQGLLQLCGWAIRTDSCFLCFFFFYQGVFSVIFSTTSNVVGSHLPNKSRWLTWTLSWILKSNSSNLGLVSPADLWNWSAGLSKLVTCCNAQNLLDGLRWWRMMDDLLRLWPMRENSLVW